MKNKNFQRSKSYGDEKEVRTKKLNPSTAKKGKNFKKKIFDEIDEFEDIDLYGDNEDIFEDDAEESDQ